MRIILPIIMVLASCVGGNGHQRDKGEPSTVIPQPPSESKRPRPYDCTAHMRECLDSPLSKVWGEVWGRTVCVDCELVCRSMRAWPSVTWDGKPCEWWNA